LTKFPSKTITLTNENAKNIKKTSTTKQSQPRRRHESPNHHYFVTR